MSDAKRTSCYPPGTCFAGARVEIQNHERPVSTGTLPPFRSILFPSAADRVPDERLAAPDFFVDLNLDQIIAAVAASKAEYNLEPFFYASLRDVDAITFRHEIMQDLENASLFGKIQRSLPKACARCANILAGQKSFTTNMRRSARL